MSSSRGSLLVTAAVVVATVAMCTALQACSDSSAPQAKASDSPSWSSQAASRARERVLSSDDLPALTGRSASVTAEDLADEADDSDVLTQLESDGFLGGFARDLRGRARDITGADSRVLVFDSADGAKAFAASVADDPDRFFGEPSTVRPMSIGSVAGYLIEPPLCDCPGAYPAYVGLVPDGETLVWLQVTGPRVTLGHLRDLLAAQTRAAH